MKSYFSIYDKVADSFSPLIGSANTRTLYRELGDKTPQNHDWRKHPSDFAVVHVLDLSDTSEVLPTSPSRPTTILTSLDMIFNPEVPNVSA